MGITSRFYVVIFSEYKESQRKLLIPGNREWVIAIKCINRSQALLSIIILKDKTFNNIWFDILPKD